jgi:hypothetical protein
MATSRVRRIIRRARPWLIGWYALQAVVALAGRLAAWRLDEGDGGAAVIRRVQTVGGLELRATNPALERVVVDLGMAGADIDLTGVGQPSRPIELTARVLMGGLAVRVPADWRVWWRYRGVGGIGTDATVARTHDEHAADLRIHATVLFGGIGVEGPRR